MVIVVVIPIVLGDILDQIWDIVASNVVVDPTKKEVVDIIDVANSMVTLENNIAGQIFGTDFNPKVFVVDNVAVSEDWINHDNESTVVIVSVWVGIVSSTKSMVNYKTILWVVVASILGTVVLALHGIEKLVPL